MSRPVGGVLSTGPFTGLWLCGHPSVRPTWECPRADRPLPVRPCSGWGLPSRPGRPGRWCALTAPFHPHLCPVPNPEGKRTGPSAVCSLWHFPAGHPDWPLASILSSGAPTFLSVADHAAATRPAHRLQQCGAGEARYPTETAEARIWRGDLREFVAIGLASLPVAR